MKTPRLVKVIVKAHFIVEEEGEIVGEFVCDPIAVGTRDWPDYAAVAFPQAVAALEAQLNEDST